MKRNSTFILPILLGVILLAACSTAGSTTNNSGSTTEFTGAKLNLNTVTGDELLATIPGFGNRMAREFKEYRPCISIQQFRQEIGKYVDEAQIPGYERYVYVPIAINDSDSETLQQIPGLDSAEADSVISNRPYASTDAFIAELSGFVSADELETAKPYLENDE